MQIAIGIWAGRFIKGESDYLLAGRSLGVGLAAISLCATWFGAETVMGSSAAIAREGLAGGRADPFGYSLCLLLMAMLLAYRMRAANYVTLADFFRDRFGTRVERLAILVFAPTSLLWTAAQLMAFSKIMEVVAGIPHETALLYALVFIVLYTIIGGMKADVIHDFLQGGVVVIGLGLLTFALFERAGGIAEAWERITPAQLQWVGEGESWLTRLNNWAIPILGSLVAQEAISRLLATQNARIARRACYLAAGLYLLIGLMPVCAGLLGGHLIPDALANTQETEDYFIITLAQELLSPLTFVLFTGALVAAILSTIDSTLLSLAAVAEHNVMSPLFPKLSERQKVKLARLCVAVFALLAYLIARSGDTIYDMLQLASSFGSAGIVVTVLIGLNLRFGGSFTAFLTLITGIIGAIIGELAEAEAAFLFTLAACLVCYLIGGLYEKSRKPALPIPAQGTR